MLAGLTEGELVDEGLAGWTVISASPALYPPVG